MRLGEGGHPSLLQQWTCWDHLRSCCEILEGCRGLSPLSCQGLWDHPAGEASLGLPWGWGHPGGVTLRILGGSTWAVPLDSHLPSLQGHTAGSPLGEIPRVWGSL